MLKKILMLSFSIISLTCSSDTVNKINYIPQTEIAELKLPITLKELNKFKTVEYSQYEGFFFHLKSSIFEKCFLKFNENLYYESSKPPSSLLQKEIKLFVFGNTLLAKNDYTDFHNEVRNLYGMPKMVQKKDREVLFYILPQKNILLSSYGVRQNDYVLVLSTEKINDIESFIEDHYLGW